MDQHPDLEATVATPRIVVPPHARVPEPVAVAPASAPAEPIEEAVIVAPRPAYVFGNPLTYALRRFLAFAVDIVLVTAVATMLLYGLIAINPLTGLPNTSEGGFDATFALGIGIAFVYLWIFEAIFGTSLGKLAFALHVYAPSRRFVGFGRAFVRNLIRPIDLLVIGWILAMLPGHRRLGDLLSGTVVARSPLRAFSPVVGWLAIIALAALPFVFAGGAVTVLAVVAAFIAFIPPIVAHAATFVLQLFGGGAPPATPVITG